MQEQEDEKSQRASQAPATAPDASPAAVSAFEAPEEATSVADEPLPVSQGTEPAPEPAWHYPGADEAAPEPEREIAAREEAEPLSGEAQEEEAEEKDGEVQAGDTDEEGRRRKRSRRGRRRKNGRTTDAAAAETESGDEEDEDDEIFADDPAEEASVPAPRRVVEEPAPAPRRAERAPRPERRERPERAERERPERAERPERSDRFERPERGELAALAPTPRTLRSPEPAFPPPTFTPAGDFERLAREIIITVPESSRRGSEERKIAMFCDFENIALGVRDSEIGKFDINLILERLIEKGKIIVKKAYADWERYSDYKRPFHEAAIELIDIPQKYYSGKNSADIKMVVDAMDLSYSKEHLDTFVILSGDSDFSPLVSKLKENNKYVIGVGVKNSSSNLLIDNCDEFIYYEDVWRDTQKGPKLDGLNKKTAEVFSLLIESIQALLRDNKEVLWGSMIKQTMQRKKPSFNEGYYGYSTFSELLEDAERKSIIKLKKDQRSGTYIVTGFAKSSGAEVGTRR
ncbi:MAG TPA: NYN domain-containing protein [Thermoanaerobaculia bacterium]|nr:NYN domain-containing protein [Thermoanaerobaculia bacterium]